jgi:DNA-directed RNA polymerase specialized sigma24 family protein
MNEPLDNLLAQLSGGDTAAAQAVFLEVEPYLRKVIRRHLPPALRVRYDSTDVLQTVWAEVLHGFRDKGWRFSSAEQLRSFLSVASRNHLSKCLRDHPVTEAGEKPPGESPQQDTNQSTPEVWERILERCAPEQRPILHLKRQGYSLVEIAARTGRDTEDIRRMLRLLARQLVFEPTATLALETNSLRARPS